LTDEFQAGVDAFRLGKLDDARKHLEAARAIDPKLPGPHRFLAAVAQAQGRWDDCITSARTAIELNPRSIEIGDTRKLHDGCRASAGRAPYRDELGDSAAIAVTTNVPGAAVKINGLTYGGTPLAPRPITAGTLEVEISKSGWKPTTRSINALAGIVTDVAVDLEADATAENTVELAPRPSAGKKRRLEIVAPGATVLVNDEPPNEEVEPGTYVVDVRAPGRDRWRRRVRIDAQSRTIIPQLVVTEERETRERVGLYVLGAGGVVIAGGFIAAMLSRSAMDEARDIIRIERSRDPARPLSETGDLAPVRTRADVEDAKDRASRWGLISNMTYGVGLVTAGFGAYLLYRGARERTDGAPAFAITPLDGGAYIAKEGAW
jgi:hypothetical protein